MSFPNRPPGLSGFQSFPGFPGGPGAMPGMMPFGGPAGNPAGPMGFPRGMMGTMAGMAGMSAPMQGMPNPMAGMGMMGQFRPNMMGQQQVPNPGMLASMKKTTGPIEKSCTVYVGKIAPTLDEQALQSLLKACGYVKSWKRSLDPVTKAFKGFGFCEYTEAESVLRAIRLLNGLKVDGQELMLKCSTATQKYVDAWEEERGQQREKEAQQRLDAAKKRQEEGEVVDEKELQQQATDSVAAKEAKIDDKALEVIMGVVSEREEAQRRREDGGGASSSKSAADAFLNNLKGGEDMPLPPPPPIDAGAAEERKREREREREREKERERERDRERGREREREREREMERDRRKELDRAYDARIKEWERHERDRSKARELDRKEAAIAEQERYRACRSDMAGDDSDYDDMPVWMRRPYSQSRRCIERRRARLEEEESDALDRQREQREAEQAAMARKRRRAAGEEEDEGETAGNHMADAASSGAAAAPSEGQGPSKYMKEEVSEVKPEPSEVSQAPMTGAPSVPDVDSEDPIYKAMMAAATNVQGVGSRAAFSQPQSHAPAPAPTYDSRHAGRYEPQPQYANPYASIKQEQPSVSPPPQSWAPRNGPTSAAPAAPAAPAHSTAAPAGGGRAVFGSGLAARNRQTAVSSVFGDDEEEKERERRKLKPIQYSAEELRVGEEIQQERARAAAAEAAEAQAQAQAAQAAKAAEHKAALKALMDRIPTTKDAVWSYPVQWSAYNPAMGDRFRQWVDAKVRQLLMGPEPSVVNFIMDLIASHRTPAEAAAELEPLLDTDTETFVIKLFRTIIFETERAKAGL